MPPTKPMRSSTTIVFSWWQCQKRTQLSKVHSIFVPRQNRSTISRTSPRVGLKTRTGAPFQMSTRTGIRSATSARRFRTVTGSSFRVSASSGEKNQPAMWTCDCAAAISSAASGRNSEPSMSTSTLFPLRGGVPPSAQPPAGVSRAWPQPTLRSRRSW